MTPNDPLFSEQWALDNTGQNGAPFGSDISIKSAWETTIGSSSTIIAVIDSGIDFSHPELANAEWTNRAVSDGSDLHGWDYIADSGEIRDKQGHGTAVAGIIAAEGNNSVGISGVMWQASLMSLRVLDNTGTGDVANAFEAIDYATSHGAQVINLSSGTAGASLALKDAIERAGRKGVVVVCSAGNVRDLLLSDYLGVESYLLDGDKQSTIPADRLRGYMLPKNGGKEHRDFLIGFPTFSGNKINST